MFVPLTPPQIYRQFFTPSECRLLDSSPPQTALSEISLLRILLMRVLAARARQPQVAIAHSAPKGERSNHSGAELSLKRHVSMLAAFSDAGLILSSLVRFDVRHDVLGGLDGALLQMFADMDPYDL